MPEVKEAEGLRFANYVCEGGSDEKIAQKLKDSVCNFLTNLFVCKKKLTKTEKKWYTNNIGSKGCAIYIVVAP